MQRARREKREAQAVGNAQQHIQTMKLEQQMQCADEPIAHCECQDWEALHTEVGELDAEEACRDGLAWEAMRTTLGEMDLLVSSVVARLRSLGAVASPQTFDLVPADDEAMCDLEASFEGLDPGWVPRQSTSTDGSPRLADDLSVEPAERSLQCLRLGLVSSAQAIEVGDGEAADEVNPLDARDDPTCCADKSLCNPEASCAGICQVVMPMTLDDDDAQCTFASTEVHSQLSAASSLETSGKAVAVVLTGSANKACADGNNTRAVAEVANNLADLSPRHAKTGRPKWADECDAVVPSDEVDNCSMRSKGLACLDVDVVVAIKQRSALSDAALVSFMIESECEHVPTKERLTRLKHEAMELVLELDVGRGLDAGDVEFLIGFLCTLRRYEANYERYYAEWPSLISDCEATFACSTIA